MREFPIRFLDNRSKKPVATVGDGFGKGFPNLAVTLDYYPELESIVIEIIRGADQFTHPRSQSGN
jgi:hypothetical protein